MNADRPAPTRWAVSVTWRDSLLPNDPELREWTAALGGGKVLLPAVPQPVGYPNVITAQVVVQAASLRQALTAGMARVEKALRCKAFDARATLIRANDRDEVVFATHSPRLGGCGERPGETLEALDFLGSTGTR